jgi:hypothetical protein
VIRPDTMRNHRMVLAMKLSMANMISLTASSDE